MRERLEAIIEGAQLSVAESEAVMREILSDAVPLTQVAALLAVLRMRGVTVDILDGFSRVLAEVATPVDVGGHAVIDVCGTGGDHKSTFNISTTVAFVLAGAGYKIAKHGNVAVSSTCGSSNVLEALGVPLTADRDRLLRSLESANICFLHAPLFHPAMKRVAPVRREVGIRTVFNALGPLINPARPVFQCNGVYSLELQRLYSYLLQRRGQRYAIVHSLDGYDEVSLTAPTRVVTRNGTREISASNLDLEPCVARDLQAPTSPEENAKLVVAILEGRASRAQRAVVVANAALAMWCYEERGEVLEYRDRAEESINSGAARACLGRSIEV